MTETLRFIHAADLHIGAPIRGLRNVSAEWAERLQRAVVDAYERVVDAALSSEVDFVVLAGDIFDTSRPSYGDYLRFFEGLEKLDAAGIPAYLVSGNHDPYTSWTRDLERLPASVRLLGLNGPEFTVYCRDERPLCLIGGRSYRHKNWPSNEKIAEGITRAGAERALAITQPRAFEAPFSIGIIHTGLDIDQERSPISQEELLASGIDYWACGHVHERAFFPSEANPRIAFPGCTQSRNIKESGDRGCLLVELSKRRTTHGSDALRVNIEFVPTSSVVLQQLDVNVSACQTLADVRRLVQAELFRANDTMHCDEMVSRITLVGMTSLHGFLARREITEDLRKHINNAYPGFYCDSLDDHTQPSCDMVRPNENGRLFSSIVADIADEQRTREDVLINYVQNEFVKRGIPVPSSLSRRIAQFNENAETLVMDLLKEESE